MKTYRGFFICPHCEEKFEWEFVDHEFRRGTGELITDVHTINADTTISKCVIRKLTKPDRKALCCYCSHCQMPVEIDDTGDIPTELFL